MQHFILDCKALAYVRMQILQDIQDICKDNLYPVYDAKTLMQLIIACYSFLVHGKNPGEVVLI